jgi:hypothetical protein
MIKSIKITVIEIETTGCITNTWQCGPCCFNTQCSQSTMLNAEPSASDWRDLTLPSYLEPLRFE